MNIAVKNLQNKIPFRISHINKAALKACGLLKLNKHKSEISITFVGPKRMQTINRRYLKHDYVTDVITFDLGDCAEIIICPQVAYQQAQKYEQQSITDELLLYVVHGLLHLAGYDDHTSKDILQMRRKERQLLNKI